MLGNRHASILGTAIDAIVEKYKLRYAPKEMMDLPINDDPAKIDGSHVRFLNREGYLVDVEVIVSDEPVV